MQQQHILITGGNGLIGKHLTQALLTQGRQVSHLSRNPGSLPGVTTYLWNIEQGHIDERCLDGVDTVVHLAGAGVADKRWTAQRRKEIIGSRTQSIALIYRLMQQRQHQVKSVISASATGYYGNRGDEALVESSAPGRDFLANCCIKWEAAVDKGLTLGLRVVKMRTGVVLSAEGGALPKLAAPVKLYAGAPLGSGRQYVPWIHLKDVVDMYLFAIENQALQGVYNMTAPEPVNNRQLTQAVARQLKKPLWLPAVPAFLLRLLLGKMSTVVLSSAHVIPQAIEQADFNFTYRNVGSALKQIYG